jgi:transcriptional regulator with XRE-family HTH domain
MTEPYRTVPFEEIFAKFTPEQQERIKARSRELIAEAFTVQELRKAQKLTQQALAKRLGVKQESISNLEARSDMLISTLRGYVEAMGGKLELIVSFPGRPSVSLEELAEGPAVRRRKPAKRAVKKPGKPAGTKSTRGLRSAELNR